jgi:hypothetical protein
VARVLSAANRVRFFVVLCRFAEKNAKSEFSVSKKEKKKKLNCKIECDDSDCLSML